MGLEIGSLAEVYRNSSPRRVCQIEVTDNYEHKHQTLSADDPSKGLRKMSIDIAQALLRAAAADAIPITQDCLQNLPVLYRRYAEDIVDRYEADAVVNGLLFDRHEEESTVRIFSQSLHEAGQIFLQDPVGAAPLPSWNRVQSAVPAAFDWIRDCALQRPGRRVFVGAFGSPSLDNVLVKEAM